MSYHKCFCPSKEQLFSGNNPGHEQHPFEITGRTIKRKKIDTFVKRLKLKCLPTSYKDDLGLKIQIVIPKEDCIP